MRRGAKWAASAICEPPKPRLITGRSGKDLSSFHIRIVELPMNRMPFLGGGFSASCFSKSAIVFSQRAGSHFAACCARTCGTPPTARATSSRPVTMRTLERGPPHNLQRMTTPCLQKKNRRDGGGGQEYPPHQRSLG